MAEWQSIAQLAIWMCSFFIRSNVVCYNQTVFNSPGNTADSYQHSAQPHAGAPWEVSESFPVEQPWAGPQSNLLPWNVAEPNSQQIASGSGQLDLADLWGQRLYRVFGQLALLSLWWQWQRRIPEVNRNEQWVTYIQVWVLFWTIWLFPLLGGQRLIYCVKYTHLRTTRAGEEELRTMIPKKNHPWLHMQALYWSPGRTTICMHTWYADTL